MINQQRDHPWRRQIFTIFDPYPSTTSIPAKCLWRGFLILIYCDLLTIGPRGHPSPPKTCWRLKWMVPKMRCSSIFQWWGWIHFWRSMIHSKIYSRVENSIENFVLWSKMLQRTGMREGGLPLPPAFQYLILMTWSACDSNLVIISSLDSKWQGLKFGMLVFQLFYEMKWKTSKFKVLAIWGQCRYHIEIQITSDGPEKWFNSILIIDNGGGF